MISHYAFFMSRPIHDAETVPKVSLKMCFPSTVAPRWIEVNFLSGGMHMQTSGDDVPKARFT